MAELRDNELNEVNGGKARMDAWDLVFKEGQGVNSKAESSSADTTNFPAWEIIPKNEP